MIARIVKWLALGFAAVAFVAVIRYAAMHPESDHPPLAPSVAFVAAMAVAGLARHIQHR